MMSVANKRIMLSVVMLSVVMLGVVASALILCKIQKPKLSMAHSYTHLDITEIK
jgi:hypothetical protein